MAQLYQIVDVLSLIDKYNLEYFIETGTGAGETLSYISDLNFKLIQSCEIETSQYLSLKEQFVKSNIKLWNGSSTDILPLMLKFVEGPCLFFLDAHFPGTGYIRKEYKTSIYSDEESLPLKKELEIIASWQHCKDSVIVIDDLRIYQSDNYEGGLFEPDVGWTKEDWVDREKLFGDIDCKFLYDTLKSTHSITKILKHQGSILYSPL